MNVFEIRKQLVRDYNEYSSSFIQIRDPRIREYVDAQLDSGLLWPEAARPVEVRSQPAAQSDTKAKAAQPRTVKEETPRQSASKPKESAGAVPAGQATLSDFGLYKCADCGKMVMGYEKENHVQEKHRGKIVEWKKVR